MQKQKATVIQQVIAYLKENIENGVWMLGEKIPSENCLKDTLGVSRASIRVAIRQFVALGMLKSIHGKGTFVIANNMDVFRSIPQVASNIDFSNMYQVLEYRWILEPEASYLAAQRANEESIELLQAHLKGMQASVGYPDEFVKNDVLFHGVICQASGNELVEKSIKGAFGCTFEKHLQMNEIFGYKDGLYYHAELLKALKEKNANGARRIMKEHLWQAIELLKGQA